MVKEIPALDIATKPDAKNIQATIKQVEKKLKTNKEKSLPNCARCKKKKNTKKHHWPLGSSRLVPLCNHCYSVTKKQRARNSKHF